MMNDSESPNQYRKHVRLREYDYAKPGAYFVTICTAVRQPLFGEITGGEMHLSAYGRVVEQCWHELPSHYPCLVLDAFAIMPDHLHAIFGIYDEPSTGAIAVRRHPLSEMVRSLKGFSTRRINELRGTPGQTVWQQNYFEHILRDEKEFHGARVYIANNVQRKHLQHMGSDHPFVQA